MKNTNIKIPLKKIVKAFNQINSKKIILLAKKIQKKLINNRSLIKNNGDIYKVVTQADIKIQKYLLNYFENSSLNGTYEVIAEENIVKKQKNKNSCWKLLIDPLDGTSSFKNQKDTWGIMIGACDMNGVLRYSYNIISTGKIYKTESGNKLKLESFKQLKKSGRSIVIDVYDYGSGASNRFNNLYKKTSYPAAIWAGWQIYQQKLNGLLWLPSNQGKKWYPDYDLIFLGALLEKGYNIIIGKKGRNNSMIAVGPTLKDTERLYEIGLNLFPVSERLKVKKIINKLKIVN